MKCLHSLTVGDVDVDMHAMPWKELNEHLQHGVQFGGLWHPTTCHSRHHIAVIVPMQNTEETEQDERLRKFLKHMHPFLQKQQLNYGIYLISQV